MTTDEPHPGPSRTDRIGAPQEDVAIHFHPPIQIRYAPFDLLWEHYTISGFSGNEQRRRVSGDFIGHLYGTLVGGGAGNKK